MNAKRKLNTRIALLTALIAAFGLVTGCQKKGAGKAGQAEPGHDEKAGPAGDKKAGPAGDKKTGPAKDKKAGPARPAGELASQLWSAGGFKVPESVLYSAAGNFFYVSNINGKPTEKNGQGFISKLSMEGKVVALKWATGFNAPKGMGLHGNTLYVTDIDRLHAVDTGTGKIKKTITVPTAKFLNDIAIGPKGEVYVSDMQTGLVHVLAKGKLPVLVDVKSFKGANGMLMEGDAILVGTATGIVKVMPATRKAAMHVPVKGFGMIDGLKAIAPNDTYIMSNWKGKTQIVNKAGKVTVVMDTSAKNIQSADFEYIAAKKMLLIPTFFNNRVVAYRLADSVAK